MYKLICNNLSKSKGSLTSFTGPCKKVAHNYETHSRSPEASRKEYLSESDLPYTEQDASDQACEVLCVDSGKDLKTVSYNSFFAKEIRSGSLGRSLLEARKPTESIRTITYSCAPSKYFYSSLIDHAKNNPFRKRTFKNREAVEMYRKAMEQCNKIRYDRYKMGSFYKSANWPPRPVKPGYSWEERDGEENAGTDDIVVEVQPAKPIQAEKPKMPRVSYVFQERRHSGPVDREIESIGIRKPHHQFKNRKAKITYPTHTVNHRIGLNKPYYLEQLVSNQKEKTTYEDIAKVRNNTKGVTPANALQVKSQSQPNLALLLKLKAPSEKSEPQTQPRAEKPEPQTQLRVERAETEAIVRRHPTVDKVSRKARMAIANKYSQLLSKIFTKNQPAKRQETIVEDEMSRDDSVEELSKVEEEAEEAYIEPTMIKHPVVVHKTQEKVHIPLKYPKKIIVDKPETYDIEATCIKHKGAQSDYDDYIIEIDRKAQRHKSGEHQTQTETPNNAAEKDELIASEKPSQRAMTPAESLKQYLKKLKDLKDQTALDRTNTVKSPQIDDSSTKDVGERVKIPGETIKTETAKRVEEQRNKLKELNDQLKTEEITEKEDLEKADLETPTEKQIDDQKTEIVVVPKEEKVTNIVKAKHPTLEYQNNRRKENMWDVVRRQMEARKKAKRIVYPAVDSKKRIEMTIKHSLPKTEIRTKKPKKTTEETPAIFEESIGNNLVAAGKPAEETKDMHTTNKQLQSEENNLKMQSINTESSLEETVEKMRKSTSEESPKLSLKSKTNENITRSSIKVAQVLETSKEVQTGDNLEQTKQKNEPTLSKAMNHEPNALKKANSEGSLENIWREKDAPTTTDKKIKEGKVKEVTENVDGNLGRETEKAPELISLVTEQVSRPITERPGSEIRSTKEPIKEKIDISHDKPTDETPVTGVKYLSGIMDRAIQRDTYAKLKEAGKQIVEQVVEKRGTKKKQLIKQELGNIMKGQKGDLETTWKKVVDPQESEKLKATTRNISEMTDDSRKETIFKSVATENEAPQEKSLQEAPVTEKSSDEAKSGKELAKDKSFFKKTHTDKTHTSSKVKCPSVVMEKLVRKEMFAKLRDAGRQIIEQKPKMTHKLEEHRSLANKKFSETSESKMEEKPMPKTKEDKPSELKETNLQKIENQNNLTRVGKSAKPEDSNTKSLPKGQGEKTAQLSRIKRPTNRLEDMSSVKTEMGINKVKQKKSIKPDLREKRTASLENRPTIRQEIPKPISKDRSKNDKSKSKKDTSLPPKVQSKPKTEFSPILEDLIRGSKLIDTLASEYMSKCRSLAEILEQQKYEMLEEINKTLESKSDTAIINMGKLKEKKPETKVTDVEKAKEDTREREEQSVEGTKKVAKDLILRPTKSKELMKISDSIQDEDKKTFHPTKNKELMKLSDPIKDERKKPSVNLTNLNESTTPAHKNNKELETRLAKQKMHKKIVKNLNITCKVMVAPKHGRNEPPRAMETLSNKPRKIEEKQEKLDKIEKDPTVTADGKKSSIYSAREDAKQFLENTRKRATIDSSLGDKNKNRSTIDAIFSKDDYVTEHKPTKQVPIIDELYINDPRKVVSKIERRPMEVTTSKSLSQVSVLSQIYSKETLPVTEDNKIPSMHKSRSALDLIYEDLERNVIKKQFAKNVNTIEVAKKDGRTLSTSDEIYATGLNKQDKTSSAGKEKIELQTKTIINEEKVAAKETKKNVVTLSKEERKHADINDKIVTGNLNKTKELPKFVVKSADETAKVIETAAKDLTEITGKLITRLETAAKDTATKKSAEVTKDGQKIEVNKKADPKDADGKIIKEVVTTPQNGTLFYAYQSEAKKEDNHPVKKLLPQPKFTNKKISPTEDKQKETVKRPSVIIKLTRPPVIDSSAEPGKTKPSRTFQSLQLLNEKKKDTKPSRSQLRKDYGERSIKDEIKSEGFPKKPTGECGKPDNRLESRKSLQELRALKIDKKKQDDRMAKAGKKHVAIIKLTRPSIMLFTSKSADITKANLGISEKINKEEDSFKAKDVPIKLPSKSCGGISKSEVNHLESEVGRKQSKLVNKGEYLLKNSTRQKNADAKGAIKETFHSRKNPNEAGRRKKRNESEKRGAKGSTTEADLSNNKLRDPEMKETKSETYVLLKNEHYYQKYLLYQQLNAEFSKYISHNPHKLDLDVSKSRNKSQPKREVQKSLVPSSSNVPGLHNKPIESPPTKLTKNLKKNKAGNSYRELSGKDLLQTETFDKGRKLDDLEVLRNLPKRQLAAIFQKYLLDDHIRSELSKYLNTERFKKQFTKLKKTQSLPACNMESREPEDTAETSKKIKDATTPKPQNAAARYIAQQREKQRLELQSRRDRTQASILKTTSHIKPGVRNCSIFIEKTLPRRYEAARKTEKKPEPITSFCGKICVPPMTLSQVAFKQSVHEATTLNRNVAQKVFVVPNNVPETSNRAKRIKILHMVIRKPKRGEEHFLPAVLKSAKKSEASFAKEEPKLKLTRAELIELRYKLLQRLRLEFDSLPENRKSKAVGNFEKVSRHYEKMVKDLKTDNMTVEVPEKGKIDLQKEICDVHFNVPSHERPLNSTELLIKKLQQEQRKDGKLEDKLAGKDNEFLKDKDDDDKK